MRSLSYRGTHQAVSRKEKKSLLERIADKEIAVGFGERPRDIMPIDRERAMLLNTNAAPLEWLVARDKLRRPKDYRRAGQIRFEQARWYRQENETCSVTALKSPAIGETSGGGFGPVNVNNTTMVAIVRLTRMHQSIPESEIAVMKGVIIEDRWLWEGAKKDHRQRIFDLLLRGLDRLAVFRGHLNDGVFREWWPGQPYHPIGVPFLYDPERLP